MKILFLKKPSERALELGQHLDLEQEQAVRNLASELTFEFDTTYDEYIMVDQYDFMVFLDKASVKLYQKLNKFSDLEGKCEKRLLGPHRIYIGASKLSSKRAKKLFKDALYGDYK